MNRYFVTVYASSKDDLRKLQSHGLDLFAQTARQDPQRGDFSFSIEGLIGVGEVETLVEGGYRVLVEDTVAARTRASQDTVEFDDWLGVQQAHVSFDAAVHD